MSEKGEKMYVSPDICMWPNDEHDTYKIEITLPGVEKETIKLKMHEDSFFVKGESKNTVYIGSYAVCCPVDAEKAKATYKEGLLKVEVPFKEPEFHSVDVNID
ncbi:MAG: Hsp20/alpha crystallin family protein [Candidatus Hermodarchaeota archaeon]